MQSSQKALTFAFVALRFTMVVHIVPRGQSDIFVQPMSDRWWVQAVCSRSLEGREWHLRSAAGAEMARAAAERAEVRTAAARTGGGKDHGPAQQGAREGGRAQGAHASVRSVTRTRE